MIEHCNTRDFSFHCLDIPGYGVSRDISATPSVEIVGESVIEYVNKITSEPFSLVVHSMTGLVGHHLGVAAHQYLDNLIFFCPVPPKGFKATENNIANMHSVADSRDALRSAILDRGGNIESEQWVDDKLELAWSASNPEVKKTYLDMFLTPVRPTADKSPVNTAKIIAGEVDLPFYREASLRDEFQPYYDEVEIVNLARCGHYPMLQNPKLAADTLFQCLQKQE